MQIKDKTKISIQLINIQIINNQTLVWVSMTTGFQNRKRLVHAYL